MVINKKAPYVVICAILFQFVFHGCATTTPSRLTEDITRYERTFSADYDKVWTATMDALKHVRIKKADKETGKLITEWFEGGLIQKGTGLVIDTYWAERYRFIISISRESERFSRMTVLCLIQEKTKGGTRSLRWVQKKSSGAHEEELLDEVERILASQ